MTYEALSVANYIVKKSLDNGKPISNIRLQKILYYLQARFLVEKGIPLFNEDIGKWKYGPVTPSVYHEFKNYGSGTIDKTSTFLKIERDENDHVTDIVIELFDENLISEDDGNIIVDTLEALKEYNSFTLVDYTHEQPLWKDYESAILNGTHISPYDTEQMKTYFESHPEEQLWRKN